jgi:phage terminase large subunit GpA-like protein
MKGSSTMHVIDLTKIEGSGDFPCPRCGSVISPEDESEDTYIIQNVKMTSNDQLEKLVIQCNKCKTIIHITGFTSF